MAVAHSSDFAPQKAPRHPWTLLQNWLAQRRRRQATIDLLQLSPYLRRDIGAENLLDDRNSR